jgi:hypothetical protein
VNKTSGNGFGRVKWMAWALCVLPLAAVAEQPGGTSNVAAESSDSTIAPSSSLDGNDGATRRRLTEVEWKAASEFLNKYSPKRMALLNQMPEGKMRPLKNLIYGRYLDLMKIKDSFPQLYDIGVQRMTIEDNLFDLRRNYRAARGPAQATVKQNMRQQVGALFDNLQNDRQARITRMQTYVSDLQKKRDDDEQHRETVIDSQLQQVINGNTEVGRGKGIRHTVNGKSAPDNFEPTTNPD